MLVQGGFQRLELDRSGALELVRRVRPLEEGEPEGSDSIRLRIRERLPAATILQKVSEGPAGRPAVLARFGPIPETGAGRERWIAQGAAEEVAAGGARFTALLVPGESGPHGGAFPHGGGASPHGGTMNPHGGASPR